MREKMKKMLFLMLFLMILGAASVTSQVRIGGNGQPNSTAVLDLNATDATNNGTKGLALPRVALSSTTTIPSGMGTPVNGLLVYNTATAGDVTPGTFYWQTNRWMPLVTGAANVYTYGGNRIAFIRITPADTVAGGYMFESGYVYRIALRPGIVPDGALCSRYVNPWINISSFVAYALVKDSMDVALLGYTENAVGAPWMLSAAPPFFTCLIPD
ncbi:hypothetical protein FACS189451_05290 [Bacteroidia bacterium]|nr:hypothetical protein FACS189451_05290 [Bacteroidia bacterium]